MNKIKNSLFPLIVKELFEQRDEQHYDLIRIRIEYRGSEGISSLLPKI